MFHKFPVEMAFFRQQANKTAATLNTLNNVVVAEFAAEDAKFNNMVAFQ
jgi:hypothetical protein